jgi:hypothetical protein
MEKEIWRRMKVHIIAYFLTIARQTPYGSMSRSRHQQNLADLEILYVAFSQKAFKGELDLTRVPLPIKGYATKEPCHD